MLPPRRLLAAAALGSALAVAPAAAGTAPGAPDASTPPSLVLVTLDTTRADHLGAYGYPFARTPNLDRLAARGTRFARVDTAAPITLTSHATILTGLLPPRHGVRDNGGFRLDGRFTTLAERLRERGYDTGAAVSAAVVSRAYGLDQGFRLWDQRFVAVEPGGPAEERDAEQATDAALHLVADLRPPFFLWVHYYDPHRAYRPPARLLAGQRGPQPAYDAEIAFVDEQLGRLLAEVAALPALAALQGGAVVAVVGDHGEMLGDHGEETHGVMLHAGARRVPMLLAGPGVPAGRVVAELARTVDLAPTLLALVGAPAPADLDGASLLPLLAAGPAAAPPAARVRVSYSESLQPLFTFRWYPLRALSDGRWLYVDAPRPRLYDLAADPAEEHDLAAERPAEAGRWRAALAGRLKEWGESGDQAPAPAPETVSAEERRRLAALGYLGGAGRAADLAGLPDPYDLADVANRLPEIKARLDGGACAAAPAAPGGVPAELTELKAILRRNRDNLPALEMAGLCLMERDRYAEALPYFEHALDVAPDDAVAHADRAGCLLRLGKPAEAEAAYRQALARDPTVPEAVANLARLLRERGDPAGAAAVVDRALAAAPSPAGGPPSSWMLERGLARVAAGRLDAALADFLAAAGSSSAAGATPPASGAARPADDVGRVALENAAQAAYRLRRAAQAALLYGRLVALDPSRPGPWKTLGAIQLYELADPAAARASFERALAVETDPGERAELERMLADLRRPAG